MAYFNYNRRKSSVAQIGDTPMGGENPIRIQSMANVSTMDTEAAVAQAIRMIEAGAEYVRFTAQGEREARNLGEIRKQLNEQGYTTPLVADIHFNPRAADAAAGEVEKVRINPGNYVDKVKTFSHLEYTDEEYAAEIEKIREQREAAGVFEIGRHSGYAPGFRTRDPLRARCWRSARPAACCATPCSQVNAIAPGYFKTEMNDAYFDSDKGQAYIRDTVPMRRLGQLSELEGPFLLLASDAGAFMTGAVLAVE